ncbi:MAG TPA: hypothetical protein VGM08_02365 [Candidatus Saccharimonadales bacterium]|jgi:hypothetical protein
MYRHKASYKHTKTPATLADMFAQYLILPSEPEEAVGTARVSFSFRNRYLTKRRVMRTIRRLRRTQV